MTFKIMNIRQLLQISVVTLFSVLLFGCAGSRKPRIVDELIFQIADSLASDRAMDFYLIGSIHEEAGEFHQAAINYQLAHLYDPNSSTIIHALSNIYLLINEEDAALAILEKGWLSNPDDEELTKSVIRVYLKKGEFGKVLSVLNSIFENRKLKETELELKAGVLTKMERLDEALEIYREILDRFEPSPKTYDKIARIQLSRNEIESAEETLKSLLSLDPGNHKVIFVLGGFLVARKEWEKAEKRFWKAIELDSLQIPYWRSILVTIAEQHDLERQLDVSKRAANLFPAVPYFVDVVAGTHQEMGQYEEAIQAADESIQLDSTRVTPWLTKAFIYHRQEQWELAGRSYRAALIINPESALVLNNYAYMFALQNSNLNEAMTMVDKAIEIEPENSAFLDTKAWLLFRQGKYHEALQQITVAIELGSESAEVLLHLASIHEAIGNVELAVKARTRAQELQEIEGK